MSKNDSIHSFQQSSAKRTRTKGVTTATKQSKDDYIMDTNNSSIVSKRSVEKLYWAGEPEYFRYFVSKFKRRSPLINRGYWLRMRAVESTVEKFLAEPSGKHRLVINLGCGYDPLPWLFLGKRAHLCRDTTFIDVDYPQLMLKKVDTISSTTQLSEILPGLSSTTSKDGLLCRSTNYAAIGCDLRNLDFLHFVLREQMGIETSTVAILFVAEVSIAYMDYDGSQAVLEWASSYDDVRFCLLEQHLPDGRDHPFAQTMLKHFNKLRTPLHAIGTMDDMRSRFAQAGWREEHINIQSLWNFWSDDKSVDPQERRSLDGVEPFDEWEEFALFASHYFLLVATKILDENQSQVYVPSILTPVNGNGRSTDTVHCKSINTPSSSRRFAALVPPSHCSASVGLHAGLGTKERVADTATYTTDPDGQPNDGPPSLVGIMCHSITPLNANGDCLLTGGRTSPTDVSSRCWLRQGGRWTESSPMPRGRYRHCTFRTTDSSGLPGIVVVGGRAGDGSVVAAMLHWSEKTGWTEISCATDTPPPRFGAVTVPDDDSGRSGLYFGGVGDDRVVMDDVWRWQIDQELKISFVELDSSAQQQQLKLGQSNLLWRFGAQVVQRSKSNGTITRWLVGGIARGPMLTRETEIISLDDFRPVPIHGSRPLFIGVSLHNQLCLGGGATCFSFGTYWNESVVLEVEKDDAFPTNWRFLTHQPRPTENTLHANDDADGHVKGTSSAIAVRNIGTSEDFKHILATRQPVILRGCSIGECVNKWTPQYLKEMIGSERVVSVHSATTQKMDFQTKNFTYEQQRFGDFIDKVERGELQYLRALSASSPSEEPTILTRDYPSIADDFQLSPQFEAVLQNMHSSPLRISSRVTMWLHYDVMANILCQVRGRKRLLLFPPSDVVHLGFEAGASSSSIDVFDSSESTKAALEKCHPREAFLEPGDILFIPPLWLHTAAPTDSISIAVNVFFRNMQSGYAAGRDVYGNRDLAAYERGRKEIGKLARSFAGLPTDMGRFYLERLAAELMSLARTA